MSCDASPDRSGDARSNHPSTFVTPTKMERSRSAGPHDGETRREAVAVHRPRTQRDEATAAGAWLCCSALWLEYRLLLLSRAPPPPMCRKQRPTRVLHQRFAKANVPFSVVSVEQALARQRSWRPSASPAGVHSPRRWKRSRRMWLFVRACTLRC